VCFSASQYTEWNKIYSARVIPFREPDGIRNGHQQCDVRHIDRKKKFPVTTLLRAIGYDLTARS
jgi:DNA-directed RNA polymerase subunit beta